MQSAPNNPYLSMIICDKIKYDLIYSNWVVFLEVLDQCLAHFYVFLEDRPLDFNHLEAVHYIRADRRFFGQGALFQKNMLFIQ